MRLLYGKIVTGHGSASAGLEPIQVLIEQLTGLTDLEKGTLNVALNEEYFVDIGWYISPHRFDGVEAIFLARCRVQGLKCLIMHPSSQQQGYAFSTRQLEIMSQQHLRTTLSLNDGDAIDVEVIGPEETW